MDHSREVKEVAQLLRSPEVQRSQERYLEAIKRVISFMTQGIDVSSLFSDLVKATNTKNLVQRKLVYLFLCNYADGNPQLAMMVVNTLQKDCRDENPTVRGLALRSLTSLRIVSLVEYVVPVVMQSLGDHTAYVRRAAVVGILKMFHLDRERVLEGDTIDRLYALLRDRDALVVANAVNALEEILADRGGMMLNKAIASHLLSRLREFNDWGQCTILQLLSRYVPEDEDEVYTLLNYLDDRMKQVNPAVVLAAAKVFIHLTKDLPHLHADIYDAIRGSLMTLVSANSPELAYVVMQHLQLLLARHPTLLEHDFRSFFIGYSDSVALKKQKIDILVDLSTPLCCNAVLDELCEYSTDSQVTVGRLATRSIGLIATRIPEGADHAIDRLLGLAEVNMESVSAEVLVAIKDILRTYPSRGPDIVSRIVPCLHIVDDVDAKSALLWILGEYGELVEQAPYILEEIIDNVANERTAAVRLALLTASARLFFKRPAEMQYMFGKLLKAEISSDTPVTESHDRALLYYRLLTSEGGGVENARRVINWPSPLTERIGSALPSQVVDVLLFGEFNSLSVAYGRPAELFISQKAPYARVAAEPDEFLDEPEAGYVESHGAPMNLPEPMQAMQQQPMQAMQPMQAVQQQQQQPIQQVFSLRSSVPMDMQQFQQMWKGAVDVMQLGLTLVAVEADKTALEGYLASLGIFTMASGVANGTLKMLCYAQEAGGQTVLLLEIKVPANSESAAMTIKGGVRQGEVAQVAAVKSAVQQFAALLQANL